MTMADNPTPETGEVPFPESSMLALRTIAMLADANPSGDIFGGWIMSQMDIAGAIYASYIVKGRLVTVAVEGMEFQLPVYVGDQVSCFCRTEKIGVTSISVHIEIWVRRKMLGQHLKVTQAIYTYVCIDENRRPTPIQPDFSHQVEATENTG